MPTTDIKNIQDLNLDLYNFRTVPQKDETQAVQAMISVSPDRFWGLMDSLLSDGYLPTENIIVLDNNGSLIVREGNRRVAALKIIYGLISDNSISLPDNIKLAINNLSQEWKDTNDKVPCTIYNTDESARVDKIVTLAHAKGDKASRDQWNAVARARYSRDMLGASEPAIDLLEKYLSQGKNLTANQAARWAGDYHLSVLDEAIKKVAPRFGVNNSVTLAKTYPNLVYKDSLESIIKDIGLKTLGFEHIRNKNQDFAEGYGIPQLQSSGGTGSTGAGSTSTESTGTGSTGTGSTGAGAAGAGSTGTGSTGAGAADTGSTGTGSAGTGSKKGQAFATNDPKAVGQALKAFVPLGSNREKVVTLLVEIKKLKLKDNPIAFCFLLRSMFEISGKAYCKDHSADGLKYKKSDGQDRNLIDVLRDITDHMTKKGADKETTKILHGALAELAKKDGFLSVTSMNQLVHNATFSLTAGDISTLFGNIFPLLHAMNQ